MNDPTQCVLREGEVGGKSEDIQSLLCFSILSPANLVMFLSTNLRNVVQPSPSFLLLFWNSSSRSSALAVGGRSLIDNN